MPAGRGRKVEKHFFARKNEGLRHEALLPRTGVLGHKSVQTDRPAFEILVPAGETLIEGVHRITVVLARIETGGAHKAAGKVHVAVYPVVRMLRAGSQEGLLVPRPFPRVAARHEERLRHAEGKAEAVEFRPLREGWHQGPPPLCSAEFFVVCRPAVPCDQARREADQDLLRAGIIEDVVDVHVEFRIGGVGELFRVGPGMAVLRLGNADVPVNDRIVRPAGTMETAQEEAEEFLLRIPGDRVVGIPVGALTDSQPAAFEPVSVGARIDPEFPVQPAVKIPHKSLVFFLRGTLRARVKDHAEAVVALVLGAPDDVVVFRALKLEDADVRPLPPDAVRGFDDADPLPALIVKAVLLPVEEEAVVLPVALPWLVAQEAGRFAFGVVEQEGRGRLVRVDQSVVPEQFPAGTDIENIGHGSFLRRKKTLRVSGFHVPVRDGCGEWGMAHGRDRRLLYHIPFPVASTREEPALVIPFGKIRMLKEKQA